MNRDIVHVSSAVGPILITDTNWIEWLFYFGPAGPEFVDADGKPIRKPRARDPVWWAIQLWCRQGRKVRGGRAVYSEKALLRC